MKLAIFDIDGTLIDSTALDHECFVDAFRCEFGIDATKADWADFPHHTDRGLTFELLLRSWSRDPTEAEIRRHRVQFLRLLRERATAFEEIAGARRFLERLRGDGWSVSLATGAWSESAKLKLELARFPLDFPLATCDECSSREDIVRLAIGDQRPKRVVIFGDGWWDARTAANLNLPFIGVGSRSGAVRTIPDFQNSEAVVALMSDYAAATAP